jgi:hypothetical protein
VLGYLIYHQNVDIIKFLLDPLTNPYLEKIIDQIDQGVLGDLIYKENVDIIKFLLEPLTNPYAEKIVNQIDQTLLKKARSIGTLKLLLDPRLNPHAHKHITHQLILNRIRYCDEEVVWKLVEVREASGNSTDEEIVDIIRHIIQKKSEANRSAIIRKLLMGLITKKGNKQAVKKLIETKYEGSSIKETLIQYKAEPEKAVFIELGLLDS